MIHEFQDQVSCETPLGHGYVWFMESANSDYWYTIILDNRAVVTFQQRKIRISRDYSHDRGISDKEMKEIISKE